MSYRFFNYYFIYFQFFYFVLDIEGGGGEQLGLAGGAEASLGTLMP